MQVAAPSLLYLESHFKKPLNYENEAIEVLLQFSVNNFLKC